MVATSKATSLTALVTEPVISEEVEEDTLTSTLNSISIVRKKSSRKCQVLTRKQRNAEVHNGSTCREDNSMSPMGVTEVNVYTVGSVLTC